MRGLLWQYNFIYEQDFFTAEDAEDTEKEKFDIKSSAFICVDLRLKTPVNYAPNLSPNSSFASPLSKWQLPNITSTLVQYR
jgi:hypothetical protein